MLEILAAELVILVSWRDLRALSINQNYLLGGMVWWTTGLVWGTNKREILYTEKGANQTKICKKINGFLWNQETVFLLAWLPMGNYTLADLLPSGACLILCSGVIHSWPLLPAPPAWEPAWSRAFGHCHTATTDTNLWLSVTTSPDSAAQDRSHWPELRKVH